MTMIKYKYQNQYNMLLKWNGVLRAAETFEWWGQGATAALVWVIIYSLKFKDLISIKSHYCLEQIPFC